MAKMLRKIDRETLLRVEDAVAAEFNIRLEDLLRKTRAQHISYPRFIVWYILRKRFKFTLLSIAHNFDFDHTSVIHGIEKVASSDLKKEADFIWEKM